MDVLEINCVVLKRSVPDVRALLFMALDTDKTKLGVPATGPPAIEKAPIDMV